MTQTMPDKLELIAKCIREGREVEVEDRAGDWSLSLLGVGVNGQIQIFSDLKYRAKPKKPEIGVLDANFAPPGPLAIELTPEVRQALEDAGLI